MEEQKALLETPLRPEHERLGARFGEYFQTRLPERYAAFEAEYRLAREAVALFDTGYQAVARLEGPDRVRYLNAVLTSNIRDLQPGQGALGLLLDPRGHILAELYSYALADHLLLLSHAMLRERTHATLEKFIIMDDATLTDLTDGMAALGLEGPRAPELLRELARSGGLAGFDPTAMAEGDHCEASLAGVACRIARRTHFGETGFELIVAWENAARLWQALLEPLRQRGGAPPPAEGSPVRGGGKTWPVGGPVGYAALTALRLEAGIPWFGADFDASVIPHEAAVDQSHISYIKGCYTGQEIVERVHSRGQVNRLRVSLAFAPGPLPAPGTKLWKAGKEVGHVTSVAPSPALGRGIGMGYVRREHAAPGSRLDWDAGQGEVISPPSGGGGRRVPDAAGVQEHPKSS